MKVGQRAHFQCVQFGGHDPEKVAALIEQRAPAVASLDRCGYLQVPRVIAHARKCRHIALCEVAPRCQNVGMGG